MKIKRTYLFIAISSISLLLVLSIQVNWILQTAKSKEDVFNEKANIILSRTTETLCADKEACENLEAGFEKRESKKIDSLFNYYMNFYNFHVDYSFEVVASLPPVPFVAKNEFKGPIQSDQNQLACHEKRLNELENGNKWKLKLNFPKKEEFILAEMTAPFITSAVLILVVLFLFWRTVLSLTAEKRISEHTTDFLNNMTHEFKTPLTNIALASKMLIKDSNTNPTNLSSKPENKIKHYSNIILEENEKLRLQVEQVLSMTALERGEIPIQKTELDFHQLIKDCLKSISIQIENKQGVLTLNLNAHQFVILGDKTHLANTLCNLIDNAIKYSREKPEIDIKTFNKDQNLIFIIADKGIGIEKEYQKKVFDKFFRIPTGNVHNAKGFGLGLAYVKKIIELHNGTIQLESEKGLSSDTNSGTTFTLTLPYV